MSGSWKHFWRKSNHSKLHSAESADTDYTFWRACFIACSFQRCLFNSYNVSFARPWGSILTYDANTALCNHELISRYLLTAAMQTQWHSSQDDYGYRGLDITVRKWDHSAHCAHLRSHPEEYVAALKAFLAKVSRS